MLTVTIDRDSLLSGVVLLVVLCSSSRCPGTSAGGLTLAGVTHRLCLCGVRNYQDRVLELQSYYHGNDDMTLLLQLLLLLLLLSC